VRIVFLGKLADLAGSPERAIAGPLDWAGLLKALEPALAAQVAGEKVRLALNGGILAGKLSLLAQDGDEIALLPPVSGG
jgi:molybdopterin synthase sulfur carrier subunit